MSRYGTPKFDKERCLKCKYRGHMMNLGWLVKEGNRHRYVYCNYMDITGISTLHKGEDKCVRDLRGESYDNCLLFEEGDAIKRREEIVLRGSDVSGRRKDS